MKPASWASSCGAYLSRLLDGHWSVVADGTGGKTKSELALLSSLIDIVQIQSGITLLARGRLSTQLRLSIEVLFSGFVWDSIFTGLQFGCVKVPIVSRFGIHIAQWRLEFGPNSREL
jgi:hypothetical protein